MKSEIALAQFSTSNNALDAIEDGATWYAEGKKSFNTISMPFHTIAQ
jgi:hypothetical protein